MSDRVALITGGARGIGKAVALDLAKQSWSVAICHRSSAKEAAEVIEDVKQRGARGLAIQCDVSDPDAAAALVRQVNDAWGRIDALINGAGPYHRISLLKETNEGWHSMFDNNLHPVFYLTHAVIAGMRERKWGRIICFSMANAEQLIAQPQFELNFYSKQEPSRGVGSGLSELDSGLRIRYEISRKVAPYIGFAYTQTFGEAAKFTREEGGLVRDPRFIFGMRVWY